MTDFYTVPAAPFIAEVEPTLAVSTNDHYAALAAEAQDYDGGLAEPADLAGEMLNRLRKWMSESRVRVVGDHDYDADFQVEFDYARPVAGAEATETLPVGLMLSRPGDHAYVPISWTFGTMTFGDTRLGMGRVIVLGAHDGLEYLFNYVCSLTRPFFSADRKS